MVENLRSRIGENDIIKINSQTFRSQNANRRVRYGKIKGAPIAIFETKDSSAKKLQFPAGPAKNASNQRENEARSNSCEPEKNSNFI